MCMKNELKIWRIPLSATICESTNQPNLTQGYEAPLVTDFLNLERSCRATAGTKAKIRSIWTGRETHIFKKQLTIINYHLTSCHYSYFNNTGTFASLWGSS